MRPNKRKSIFFAWILLSLSFSFFLRGLAAQSFPAAPDFQITDLEGKRHTLMDYQGKILLLNFWATWCPPCRAEIPDFVQVYAEQKSHGLEILGLSVDNLSASELKAFSQSFKINYPVALATEDIIRNYQPGNFIPTTIFIDQKGRIRHKHVGRLDKNTLLSWFRKLKEELN